MNVEELKDHIRDARRAGAEFRRGLGAQVDNRLPDYLNNPENLGAAQLLFDLSDDIDNLDHGVAASFLALISEDGDSVSVFLSGEFGEAVEAVGVPLKLTDGKPWQPSTATEFLRFVVARAGQPA